MTSSRLRIESLSDDLPFGSRVFGATVDNLADETVRRRLWSAFEERGVLVFEGIEPSVRMHLEVSHVFGPIKEHPDPLVKARTAIEGGYGIVDLVSAPGADRDIIELEGKPLANWLPWHFDLLYSDKINRAGVLRAVDSSPDGGLTGFADGIQLYASLPPDLREQIEGETVIYTRDFLLEHQRFGKPANIRVLATAASTAKFSQQAASMPRALHPAVWQRSTGEKVLHVSGIHAVGLMGREDAEGDALLERVCEEIMANRCVYYHSWKPDQIVAWDNWRILHCVTGTDPNILRRMHRTTIEGDYGLGHFEDERVTDHI